MGLRSAKCVPYPERHVGNHRGMLFEVWGEGRSEICPEVGNKGFGRISATQARDVFCPEAGPAHTGCHSPSAERLGNTVGQMFDRVRPKFAKPGKRPWANLGRAEAKLGPSRPNFGRIGPTPGQTWTQIRLRFVRTSVDTDKHLTDSKQQRAEFGVEVGPDMVEFASKLARLAIKLTRARPTGADRPARGRSTRARGSWDRPCEAVSRR